MKGDSTHGKTRLPTGTNHWQARRIRDFAEQWPVSADSCPSDRCHRDTGECKSSQKALRKNSTLIKLETLPDGLLIIIKILDFLLFALYFVASNALFIINESIDSKKYSRPVQKERKLLERGKVPWGTESFPESVLN